MRDFSHGNHSGGRKLDERRSRASRAWWLLVPIALALMVFSPWKRALENFFYPYLVLPAHGAAALSDSTLLLRSKSDLAQEVIALQKRNFELARAAKDGEQFAAENRELRNLLALEPRTGFRYVACDVVLRDPWNWGGGFTIGRGSEAGLQPGQPVMAAMTDGSNRAVLLGVIESVSRRSARVTSILNPAFRLSVRLPESDAVGFLNAAEGVLTNGGIAIDFLPANTTFALHEPVYTTGFEPLIPEGIYLGNLDAIAPAALPFGNRLYRSATMRPAADLQKLHTVMVACPAGAGEERGE